jgi:hypothetical protein
MAMENETMVIEYLENAKINIENFERMNPFIVSLLLELAKEQIESAIKELAKEK